MTDKPRIIITVEPEIHEQIKLLANKQDKYISEVVRKWIIEGLNGELSKSNLDVITRIIREQLKDILKPYMERIAALNAKNCMQSSTAAYLSAEAIARLVPEELQEDMQEVYTQARKKAVIYTKQRPDDMDI